MLHPVLRILLLLLLAIMAQSLAPRLLGLLGVLLLGLALWRSSSPLLRMLRRSRWLFLTLLLVFSFSTPGEYLPGWPLAMAPTYEGLASGLLQAGRLLVMLTGLSLLLTTTSRELLLAGLFFLLRPLAWVGLPPERFTARLWLTLHYAESAPASSPRDIWRRFDSAEPLPDTVIGQRIPLVSPPPGLADYVVGLAALGGVFWWLS